jgi:hypothetical protein
VTPAGGRRWTLGRWAWVAALVLLIWFTAAAVAAAVAALQARTGRDELRALRHGKLSALVDGTATATLARAERHLDRSHTLAASPLTWPLRTLPVVGRQLRSLSALSGAGADLSEVASRAAGDVRDALGGRLPGGSQRVDALRRAARAQRDVVSSLDGIELGPSVALVDPLRTARDDAARTIAAARRSLTAGADAVEAVATMLDSGRPWLVLAANNAEMRAGSGTFLRAAALRGHDGVLRLDPMVPTASLALEPGQVTATGVYADVWDRLRPTEEWRNLALSPNFDATAALAARMWVAAGREPVAGVIAVDPFALRALLRVTGPVTVGDRTTDATGVLDELLHGQYAGLPAGAEPDEQGGRGERLGAVAVAAIDRLSAGTVDAGRLVDELVTAARARHVLVWAADPPVEQAWQHLGVAGRLSPDSVMVSVQNRGANKLDYFLGVDADLTCRAPSAGRRRCSIAVELRNATPPGESGYVAGPNPEVSPPLDAGVYGGLLTVNLPGDTHDARVDGVHELDAGGLDGDTVTLSTYVDVAAGARRRTIVRFELPAGRRWLRIEPSARFRPVHWTVAGHPVADDARRAVEIG